MSTALPSSTPRSNATCPRWAASTFSTTTLLNLTYNTQLGDKSEPFAGIAFQPMPVPQISSIEGCAAVSADGRTTTGCVPTSTVITLHGSGFSSLNFTDFYIYLGTRGQYATLNTGYGSEVLSADGGNYTDSRLTFSIADTYNNLLIEEQYDGRPVPCYLANVPWGNGYYTRQYWETNIVYLQFDSLPPPTLSSFDNTCCNQQCNVDATTGAFIDCTPGRTRIELTGHYLYPGMNITVGGVLATLEVRASVTSATFILPLWSFDPAQRYNLTVTTVAGSVTWPAAFSFSGTPVIAWVDPCTDTGFGGPNGVSLMKCFDGERITLHVANFNLSTLTTINLTSPWTWQDEPLRCGDVLPSADGDPLLASCVVPERWSTWSYVQLDVGMTAYFNDMTRSNTLNHLWVYDLPLSPRVTSVVGCSTTLPATSLQLTQCLGGEVLTMTGVHFTGYNVTISFDRRQGLGQYECEPQYVINDTTLECQLPIIDLAFQYGVAYMMTLNAVFYYDNNPYYPNPTTSNGIYITFLSDLPPSVVSSSSSSSSPSPSFSSFFSSISCSSSSSSSASSSFPSASASSSFSFSSLPSFSSSHSSSSSSSSQSGTSSTDVLLSTASTSSASGGGGSSSGSDGGGSGMSGGGSISNGTSDDTTSSSNSRGVTVAIAVSVTTVVLLLLACAAVSMWKRSAVLSLLSEQRSKWSSAAERRSKSRSGGRVEMLRRSSGGYNRDSSNENKSEW